MSNVSDLEAKVKAEYEKMAADPQSYFKKKIAVALWVPIAALVLGVIVGALLF